MSIPEALFVLAVAVATPITYALAADWLHQLKGN